jgi:hypothetical protein
MIVNNSPAKMGRSRHAIEIPSQPLFVMVSMIGAFSVQIIANFMGELQFASYYSRQLAFRWAITVHLQRKL